MSADISDQLLEQVGAYVATGAAFNITGNQTKGFLGISQPVMEVCTSLHSGVVSYEPTELVLTARAGSRIRDLQQLLAEQGQMMPFEPPVYGDQDTLGGVIACGLSGPRRPYSGSARDFVLGTRIINGRGESLRFGGEVMKNVAGYDVSRLMVGAMGTLGLILDVSLKVLPLPETELTLRLPAKDSDYLLRLNQLARQPMPISATCYDDEAIWVRLSGSHSSVEKASLSIGGDRIDGTSLWQQLADHTHPFFELPDSLWRISIAPHASNPDINGSWLTEWGGGQRWLKSSEPAAQVFEKCRAAAAHATCYHANHDETVRFQPLTGTLLKLHQRLKTAFDPQGLINPGRYHADI